MSFWESRKTRAAKAEAVIESEVQSRTGHAVNVAMGQIRANMHGWLPGGFGGGEKYQNGISGSGVGAHVNHRTTRTNARVAIFDSPTAKAIVTRIADTVADTGLKVECTPNTDILGLTPEQGLDWAENVQQLFHLWAKSKTQSRHGQYSFYQSQRMYMKFQIRDNDMFVRLFYSRQRSLLSPLQFSFIDPDQINGSAITTTDGLASTTEGDGITRDAQGREISYSVWTKKGNGQWNSEPKKIPAVGSRSKRIMMLHGFTADFAGQGRGFSQIAHIIQELQKLTDFTLAQIEKAITQSINSYYVKPSKDAPAVNSFGGLAEKGGIGPDNATLEQSPTVTGTGGNVQFKEMPRSVTRTAGGTVVANGQPGEELVALPNTAPSESYDAFVKSFVSNLSASSGIPVEVLFMQFGANYSASRATLMLFWRIVGIHRQEMVTDYLAPVFEMWLSEAIAKGQISAPGFSDPTLKAAWLNCNWKGTPMPNIDPKRTADAERTHIELGMTDLDTAASDHNGSSGKKNRAVNAKAIRELTPLPAKSGGSSANTVGG